MLTGSTNWVAAPGRYELLIICLFDSKTNIVYEWKTLVSTDDLAGMSLIEETILRFQEVSV
ncbi:MAG: hypothetical protein IPP79_21405 [Chitinophagaceae bacterium]|nr:hypothetical protein [Chitinophagaceae bacterium]